VLWRELDSTGDDGLLKTFLAVEGGGLSPTSNMLRIGAVAGGGESTSSILRTGANRGKVLALVFDCEVERAGDGESSP